MKNYLIITLGTRDVQILKSKLATNGWNIIGEANSRNFKISKDDLVLETTPNTVYPEYLLVAPRQGGKYILEHLHDFLPIIELPLIQPLLDQIQSQNIQITDYLLIYTDQEQSYKEEKIKVFHFNNDTLYFKDIIHEVFKTHTLLKNAQPDEYGIFEEVANIDYQYDHFGQSKKDILIDNFGEIGEIFLLPQGGIDQINHAITLQLLQAFKSKVRLFQQPEAPTPVELTFPQKFLHDLNKQKIVKHLEDYDFDKAEMLLFDDTPLKQKLSYAVKRLNLNYEGLFIEELGKRWEELSVVEQKRVKIQDLTYNFKIQMRQAKYNEALTKLYTIYENLFKQLIDEIENEDTGRYYIKNVTPPNEKWEAFLDKLGPSYLEDLQRIKIVKIPLDLNNPNAFTYFYLLRFLARDKKVDFEENKIKKLNTVLQKLRDKRNAINHSMGAVLKSEIDEVLGNQKITENEFYTLLDSFAKTHGLGFYEFLRQECLGHFG